MSTNRGCELGCIGLLLIGALGVSQLTYRLAAGPAVQRAQTFENASGTVRAMRTYKRGRDSVFVEHPYGSNEYVPLNTYLQTIENKDERAQHKTALEILVGLQEPED